MSGLTTLAAAEAILALLIVAEKGINVSTRFAAMMEKARAQGRTIDQTDLDLLAAQSDASRDAALAAIEAAKAAARGEPD